jgi:hypothetical protein
MGQPVVKYYFMSSVIGFDPLPESENKIDQPSAKRDQPDQPPGDLLAGALELFHGNIDQRPDREDKKQKGYPDKHAERIKTHS